MISKKEYLAKIYLEIGLTNIQQFSQAYELRASAESCDVCLELESSGVACFHSG